MKPAGPLRPFVASYSAFDMAGWPPGRHRGLPGETLTLVVTTGTPLIVRRAGHADLTSAATVAGLRSSPFDIVHDCTQRGVQVELTPRGARALLGLPAAALDGGAWPLEEVIGRRAAELTDRLATAPGQAGWARVLDAVLAEWTADAGYPPAVGAFWNRLTGCAGRIPVAGIAAEIGLGRRQMSQLVRAELGLTPKLAARIVRFSRARGCLRTGRTGNLAQTAVMCGYFDQAHMANDWRQFAGCTPREWMSQELPFLQDQGPRRGTD